MIVSEHNKTPPPSSAPPQSAARIRHRRHRSSDSTSSGSRLWPIGVAIILPTGTLGVVMIIVGLLTPQAVGGGFFRLAEMGIVATLMIGLAMTLVGITPRSRRLRQPSLWGALLLAVVTIGGMIAVHIHARSAGAVIESPAPDAGE
jgi:hypothetical protein